MTRIQYASAITPPAPTLSTISGTTTSASAGTKYLWLYSRNRAGVTDFSPVATITITAGQGIAITIPSAVRTNASDIHEIGVVMHTLNSPQSGCVVATYPGFEADQITLTPLPATIELTEDSHFELRKAVTNLAGLPNSPVIGMRRLVDSTNSILAYDGVEWGVVLPQTFNPWVGDTTIEGGCNVDLRDITLTEAIIFPEYDASGDFSIPVKYWLVNDTDFAIQNKRIRISVATDDEDIDADDYKGLLQIKFLGYVNTATGLLDTSGMTVDTATSTYQGDTLTNLKLPKPLLPGYAYILQVQMAFDTVDVGGAVAQGAVVKVFPRITPQWSEYNPIADFTGDYILPVGERVRILPNGVGLSLVAGTGSGSVKYFKFPEIGRQTVVGATLDTANQTVVITNDGTCYVSNTIPTTGTKRAVIGTVDGVGVATNWVGSIALSSATLLRLSLSHPTTVRSSYPDLIAGMSATLNANKVRVYVRPVGGGTIQVFESLITGEEDEVITVGGSSVATISDLPTIANNFGCFIPNSFTRASVSGASVFSSGNYEVAIAYVYEDTITTISHALEAGCIYEITGSLTDLFQLLQIVRPPVASVALARDISPTTVYPWQNLFIVGLMADFHFIADSLAVDDGVNVIKLSATSSDQPGRFHRKTPNSLYESVSFPLVSNAPPTNLGIRGDYYLDFALGRFWKKNPTWAIVGSISGGGGSSAFDFDGQLVCTNDCALGGKAFAFDSVQFGAVSIVVSPNFQGIISTYYSNAIQIHRWTQEPNSNMEGRHWLADLPYTGGEIFLTADFAYKWVSIFARNLNQSDAFDAVCFSVNGNVITLEGFS